MKMLFMDEVYRLLCTFLGKPPSNFDWEYMDKSKNIIKLLQ